MLTKLLYLDDSYQKTMEASVLEVEDMGSGKYKLILDQTVFYPMGGGQATDQGKLFNNEWEGKVIEVVLKDGEVRHLTEAKTLPTVGMKVTGEIDWDRRYKLMKIHSGGHIVDFAMYLLGYSPKALMPYKGDHGKKAFIAYHGVLDREIKQELEDKANELIQKDLSITWTYASLEELQKDAIYLQPGLPTNKPLRKITLESVGSVADGGTQVKKTSEVGKVQIESIASESGETVVWYKII